MELEKKVRSKLAELHKIPMADRASHFQHLGLLALSQGQGLVYREHTAVRANCLEAGWGDTAWKLQVLGVGDKIE